MSTPSTPKEAAASEATTPHDGAAGEQKRSAIANHCPECGLTAPSHRLDCSHLFDHEKQTRNTPAEDFPQPAWSTVQQAFVDGCREARANPEANEEHFGRASDAYCKLKYHDFAGVFSAGEKRENDALDALITLALHASDKEVTAEESSKLVEEYEQRNT